MGQYYLIVNIDRKEFVRPNGVKLMEHAYIYNRTMNKVESLLSGKYEKSWKNDRVIWFGDYYELPPEYENIIENCMGEPLFTESEFQSMEDKPPYLIASEFYTHPDFNKGWFNDETSKEHRYIVNVTDREYIDKNLIESNGERWKVHPLPILNGVGIGLGSGDYRSRNATDEYFISSWAGSRVHVTTEKPPEGYICIKPHFRE